MGRNATHSCPACLILDRTGELFMTSAACEFVRKFDCRGSGFGKRPTQSNPIEKLLFNGIGLVYCSYQFVS